MFLLLYITKFLLEMYTVNFCQYSCRVGLCVVVVVVTAVVVVLEWYLMIGGGDKYHPVPRPTEFCVVRFVCWRNSV